jgi:hypothetical protein
MAEPTSVSSISLVGLGVALFGTAAGPYAAIVFAALAGALYSTSRFESQSRLAAGLALLRVVLVAVAVSGAAVWALQTAVGVSSEHVIPLVSFAIALWYDHWPAWGKRAIEMVIRRRLNGG